MDVINVVCAVIFNEKGELFACQRSSAQSHAGKWEFPGGKVESGEDPADALVREISEELGCAIVVGESLPVVELDYPEVSIRLMPYRCQIIKGCEPSALEHAELRWISLKDCPALDWAEADVPIWERFAVGLAHTN